MKVEFYRRRTHRRNNVLTGADRRGFQGTEAALSQSDVADLEEPRFECAAVLIDTMRFTPACQGAEPAAALSAKSLALFYYLLANARFNLDRREDQEFSVSFAAAKSYLRLERTDRLRRYVDAINNTMVTYDLREPGYRRSVARPLLLCDSDRKDADGEPCITFSLGQSVHHAMLSTRRYALLELNAFRRFRSKYTARLYPSLALLAGQTIAKPLVVTPEELASRLGWVPRTFHWGSFLSRALQPILDDINPAHKKAPAVNGFRVEMELVRGKDRGRPVEKIEFHVLPNELSMRRRRAARLSTIEAAVARSHVDGLDASHSPATVLLAQAVTASGRNVFQIRNDWAATVRILLHESHSASRLRLLLEVHGVGAAFSEWVDKYAMTIPTIEGQAEGSGVTQLAPPVIDTKNIPKAERRKEHAIDVATTALKQANNIRRGNGDIPDTPCQYGDDHIRLYADPEMWVMLEGAGIKPAALIQKAFGLTAHQEGSQMRKSIYNLAGAIAEWNIIRATRIAKAIIANGVHLVAASERDALKPPSERHRS